MRPDLAVLLASLTVCAAWLAGHVRYGDAPDYAYRGDSALLGNAFLISCLFCAPVIPLLLFENGVWGWSWIGLGLFPFTWVWRRWGARLPYPLPEMLLGVALVFYGVLVFGGMGLDNTA